MSLILTFKSRMSQVKKYVKPTDRHQYLHPEHTKRSVVFNQTLHVTRICSRENDLRDHCLQMRSWFLKIKYLGDSLIMK